MSCSNITQGISKGCNNNLGGIRNIYISTNPITGYVLSGGIITGFSPTPTWLTIEADQGTGNFTETYEINQAGSIIAFKQSVTFQINDLLAYNQQRIKELAESTNLGVVVEMNNGKFFTVGIERGAYLETGSTGSGTGYGDLSGSTITITGMEKISSLEVRSSSMLISSTAFYWQWNGGGVTYNFANTNMGPTYTSQESAAIAIDGYSFRCNSLGGQSWQGVGANILNINNPINASPTSPIAIYFPNGVQRPYSNYEPYQYANYWDMSFNDPNYCAKLTTHIYQMEFGDIGGNAYITNATLLYSI